MTAAAPTRAAELGMNADQYAMFRRSAEGYAAANGLLLTEGGIRWAEDDLLKLLHALDVIARTPDATAALMQATARTSRLWSAYRAKTRHRHHRSHR